MVEASLVQPSDRNGLGLSDACPQPQTEQEATPLKGAGVWQASREETAVVIPVRVSVGSDLWGFELFLCRMTRRSSRST